MEMFEEKGLPKPIKPYIERWVGKHPTPYDFFFTMNDLFGENLDWYWKPWYFAFCSPDLSIQKVNQGGRKTTIIIKNPGQMPLPIYLTVYLSDGSTETIKKSAYVWKDKSETIEITLKSQSAVSEIELGHNTIPDINIKDNIWSAN
jgi:aminopeptidase N